MKKNDFNVGICGAGNVSFHFTPLLSQKCNSIFLYNKTKSHAGKIINKCDDNVVLLDQPDFTAYNIDLLLIIVKETAIEQISQQLKIAHNTLLIHTAGAIPIDILKPVSDNYGCLYPLQTFSKKKEINISKIPLFIESNHKKNTQIIRKFANFLSSKIYELKGDKRKILHLAAVFACNFVNHCWSISSQILQKENLSVEMLHPLIYETLEKAKQLGADKSQTGPAIREDFITIQQHLQLLHPYGIPKHKNCKINDQPNDQPNSQSMEDWRNVYQTMTNSIIKSKRKDS